MATAGKRGSLPTEAALRLVRSQAPDAKLSIEVAISPERRREIGRALIAKYRETLEILEAHDGGEQGKDEGSR